MIISVVEIMWTKRVHARVAKTLSKEKKWITKQTTCERIK
jgi:hypothetical protein